MWLIVGQFPIKSRWWEIPLALRDFSWSNKQGIHVTVSLTQNLIDSVSYFVEFFGTILIFFGTNFNFFANNLKFFLAVNWMFFAVNWVFFGTKLIFLALNWIFSALNWVFSAAHMSHRTICILIKHIKIKKHWMRWTVFYIYWNKVANIKCIQKI